MVVVAFVAPGDLRILLEELSLEPSPPRQWIGAEAWVTDPEMLRFSFCVGAFGFGIEQSVIPHLREFLLDLPPAKVAASPVFTEFWEDAFNCRLGKSENILTILTLLIIVYGSGSQPFLSCVPPEPFCHTMSTPSLMSVDDSPKVVI